MSVCKPDGQQPAVDFPYRKKTLLTCAVSKISANPDIRVSKHWGRGPEINAMLDHIQALLLRIPDETSLPIA